jgi:membrane-associated phospholipid phosphatase
MSRGRGRPLLLAALLLGAFVVALAIDHPLLALVRADNRETVERRDLYQIFRQVGHILTWAIIAAALLGTEFARSVRGTIALNVWRRPLLLILSPALAGLAAELLKILLRRQRPTLTPEYAFRPIADSFWNASGLGLPSSHAAVAFGGACAAAMLFRGSGWILLPVAALCACTRMISNAHYPSDVTLGAIVGFLVARTLVRATARNPLASDPN